MSDYILGEFFSQHSCVYKYYTECILIRHEFYIDLHSINKHLSVMIVDTHSNFSKLASQCSTVALFSIHVLRHVIIDRKLLIRKNVSKTSVDNRSISH